MLVPGPHVNPPIEGNPGNVGSSADGSTLPNRNSSVGISGTFHRTVLYPPRRQGHLPLVLGRGLPFFVGMGALGAILFGYAAYTWGVVANGPNPHDGHRVYELNSLLWMPFALQDSVLITVAREGGRAIIDDPRITNPVLMVQTIFYWIALGLGSSGGLVNLLGVAGILKHPDAGPRRRSRRGPSPETQTRGPW